MPWGNVEANSSNRGVVPSHKSAETEIEPMCYFSKHTAKVISSFLVCPGVTSGDPREVTPRQTRGTSAMEKFQLESQIFYLSDK